MSIENIYQRIVAAGKPLKLPGCWRSLPCDPSFFRLSSPFEELLKSLQSEFEPTLLIASGVMHLGADGGAVMNPLLSSPQPIFWALRRDSATPPYQLVVNQQSVLPNSEAFHSIFGDGETTTMLDDVGNRVFVAFSMRDLAILRSLKLPAAPAAGLSRLDGPRLASFCKLLRLRQDLHGDSSTNAAATDSSDSSCSLALCDWAVETFDHMDPTPVDNIWEYWLDLQRHLNLGLGDFERLNPTPAELAKFRFIVDHRRWNDLRDALLDGPYTQSRSLLAEMVPAAKSESLFDATAKWLRAKPQNADAAVRQAAWSNLLATQERLIFAPLTEQAEGTGDANKRNLLLALNGMSRLLHPQAMLLAEKLGQAHGGQGTGTVGSTSQAEFQQVFGTADRILQIYREIRACRTTKSSTSIVTPRKTPTRSSGSGSRR